jgi:hypothetical protein
MDHWLDFGLQPVILFMAWQSEKSGNALLLKESVNIVTPSRYTTYPPLRQLTVDDRL